MKHSAPVLVIGEPIPVSEMTKFTCLSQKVLLKEVSELSNYIDKSQLPASLGGYLIYCHQSWVSFVKVVLFSLSKPVNIWRVLM